MKEGYLHYNIPIERYCFCPSGREKMLELHCGDDFEISIGNDKWESVALEAYGKDGKTVWYVHDGNKVLYRGLELEGLMVRM